MDGSDGGPAEVIVTGTGGDLLQMVALLNTGLFNPAAGLELTQLYQLEPGKRYVEIETIVKNTSTGAHPFPYLDPTQLDDLLGRSSRTSRTSSSVVPIGQLPLLGGEQDLFAPGVAGFNVRFAIEDSYKNAGGFPGVPGHGRRLPREPRQRRVVRPDALPDSPDNYVDDVPDAAIRGRTSRRTRCCCRSPTRASPACTWRSRRRSSRRKSSSRSRRTSWSASGDVASVLRHDLRAARHRDRHVRWPRRRRAHAGAGRARRAC